MTNLTSLLVANRGEIAVRVFRTARALGLATVAVHSDPDADALHVREADAAVRLPGAAPADTYLRGDLVIKAALAAGADAVHPGYGFLSENAGFARDVAAAGLTWIGPPPEAIEAMASKTRAKELMRAAGVPLLDPVDPAAATAADLPLLLKAAAGGGGRGMRVVRDLDTLKEEMQAASAEAASAFGDGEVFAEPYVERGRHVEVQILADSHGTVWALGTRDCSLQRRHQKVIEEAPAPALPETLRTTLHEAAVAAARAVSYQGAGTVEFLVAADGRPYFLEMNTRLQVEHPVTEAVFGLDLVALQLRIAEGAALPLTPPEPTGHAVEARLYAEDPAQDWRPQTGVLHTLDVPGGGPLGEAGEGPRGHRIRRRGHRRRPLRPDARQGRRPRPHPGRGSPRPRPRPGRSPHPRSHHQSGAPRTLPAPPGVRRGTARHRVLRTPPRVPHRRRPGRHPVRGRRRARRRRTGRGRPARHPARRLAQPPLPAADPPLQRGRHRVRGPLPARPQRTPGARGPPRRSSPLRGTRARQPRSRGRPPDVPRETQIERRGRAGRDVHRLHARRAHPHPVPRFADPQDRTEPGSLLAPMPGTVVRVAEGLAPGAAVTAGQPLLWLEAMKMEHRIVSPASGTLTALHATLGHQVEFGALLAVVQEETPA